MTYPTLILGIVLLSAAGAQGSHLISSAVASSTDVEWGQKPGWACRVVDEKNGRIFARVKSLPGDSESYQLKVVAVQGRIINPVAAVSAAQRVDLREPLFVLRGETDDQSHAPVELMIDRRGGGFEDLPSVLDINRVSIDMLCSQSKLLIEPVPGQVTLQ